jgi:hypothetical protein
MVPSHPQYTEYEVSIYSKVVCLWFTKSSVSTVELNLELKPQANNIRISPNLTNDAISTLIDWIWSFNWFQVVYLWFTKSCVSVAKIEWSLKFQLIPLSLFLFFFLFNILIWLETVTRWNITLFFLFLFCLDDADTKNKKMDTNTEKLKGTLNKTKITEGYDLVSEPSSNTNWCEPHNHVVTQPTIKIEIWSRKAEIGLIGVWHNGNLPQGINTIGLSRMTLQSQLIFDKSN